MTTITCKRLIPAFAVFCAVVFGAALWAPPAGAQVEEQEEARPLFVEGRQLMKAGRYSEACAKFEAASKWYAGSGVLLNLADCYERTNRTASAWSTFVDAALAAVRLHRAGDEAEAKRRQAALEPRLSRLVVRVQREVPRLIVKRDGVTMDSAAWGVALAVDPGTHVLSAEASGRASWSTSVTVTQPGATVTVEVPDLPEVDHGTSVDPPNPAVAGQPEVVDPQRLTTGAVFPSSPAASRGSVRAVVGLVIGGAGIVIMGGGGVLGLVARSQFDSASAERGPARETNSRMAARTGDLATVVVGVGAAVTVVGAVVWLTAPTGPVAISTNGSGLLLRGAFE
jgi:hypothetical protein